MSVEGPHRLHVYRSGLGFRYELMDPTDERLVGKSRGGEFKRPVDAIAAARHRFDDYRILVVERPT